LPGGQQDLSQPIYSIPNPIMTINTLSQQYAVFVQDSLRFLTNKAGIANENFNFADDPNTLMSHSLPARTTTDQDGHVIYENGKRRLTKQSSAELLNDLLDLIPLPPTGPNQVEKTAPLARQPSTFSEACGAISAPRLTRNHSLFADSENEKTTSLYYEVPKPSAAMSRVCII